MSDSRHKQQTVREYVESFIVTIILALFGVTFLVQAFKIPSSSMEKTLLVGDHLLVSKFSFAGISNGANFLLPYLEVRRGDIIVFKYPFPPHQHFVKRVIGLPGDRLKILESQVYINGRPLAEPYKVHSVSAARRASDSFPSPDSYFAYWMRSDWAEQIKGLIEGNELVLPPGKYFVLGDNRNNSQDSRYWGLVDRTTIIGRPLFIYWSFARLTDDEENGAADGSGPNALTAFFARTRWKRFLRLVR